MTAAIPPRVDAGRLRRRLEALGEIGRTPQGGVTRLSFQAAHTEAVRLAAGWMREAGAEAARDRWGNVFGLLPGTDGARPPLAAGSHLDTVPNGGLFDGTLGVVGAIEAASALRASGTRLRHPLLLIAFAEEEGTSFGVGCLGSLGAVGRAPALETVRDAEGVSAAERLRAFDPGLPLRALPEPLAAYLELHIEQGPWLVRRGVPLGAVEAIVGIARTTFVLTGEANHAGTTPMDGRRDALWGAADLIGAVRDLARRTDGRAVGTVGRCQVLPGASNVVPGRVEAGVELRSADAGVLDTLRGQVEAAARECAARYGLTLEAGAWRAEPPAPLDAGVRAAITAAAGRLGWPIVSMPSWAGHDAKIMAARTRTGMIFVPSERGISHSPREHTSWEDAARGAEVLCAVLERLDAEEPW